MRESNGLVSATCSSPGHGHASRTNAHFEQKNGDVVRWRAFDYRYDTTFVLQLLDDFYTLARVRLKMFTATTKAINWRSN